MHPTHLRELTRTVLIALAIALLIPLAMKWVGPFSEHPERVLAILVPLAIVIAVLGWPAYRDARVLLGGGFLAFFLGFCVLFSIAAASDLLSGRRTPLTGYEAQVPRSVFGFNFLGDWRYRLLPRAPWSPADTLVFTLDPTDVGTRRRNFAALISQASQRKARGIAFDFYFDAPSDLDEFLCGEVQRATEAGLPVYFGYKHVEREGLIDRQPLPDSLSCLENHLASLAGYREADGTVRMVPLYLQQDQRLETLSLKIARDLAGREPTRPESGLVQFTRPVPDLAPFRGMPTPAQLASFADRFIMVGSARGGDVHATPFGALPGVKIHELAARSLARGRFIERLGAGWTFPLIFALCFVLVVAQARGVGAKRLGLIGGALVAATVGLAAAAFRWGLVWVDISYVLLAVSTMSALLVGGAAVQRTRRKREAVLHAVDAPVPAFGPVTPRVVDVFLSHNGNDKPLVRELAEALRDRGLDVWLDEWELVPGRPWQEAIQQVIQSTRTAAVLVGPDGLGPWEIPEVSACLEEGVRRNMPVIPVLLPRSSTTPTLPPFLKRFTWVDLRGGLDRAGLDQLEWGITGVKPRAPRAATVPVRSP